MVVLRSREVAPPEPNPKTLTEPATTTTNGPTTPAQTSEPSATHLSPSPESNPPASDSAPLRRRSLRLHLRLGLGLDSGSAPETGSVQNRTYKRRKTTANPDPVEEEEKSGIVFVDGNAFDDRHKRDSESGLSLSGVLSLRSGKTVVRRKVEYDGFGTQVIETRTTTTAAAAAIVNGKLEEDTNGGEGEGGNSRGREEKGKMVEDGVKLQADSEVGGSASRAMRRYSREEKGKEKFVGDVSSLNGQYSMDLELQKKFKGVEDMTKSNMDQFPDTGSKIASQCVGGSALRARRYSREEKGEEKLVGDVSCLNGRYSMGLELETKSKGVKDDANMIKSRMDHFPDISRQNASPVVGGCALRARRRYGREEKGRKKLVGDVSSLNGQYSKGLELETKAKGVEDNKNVSKSRMDQFLDIARQNASRFAHFEVQEEVVDRLSCDVDVGMQSAEEEHQQQKVEDWPGPFSTAMKIIRDRANKVNAQQGTSTLKKAKSGSISWSPRKNQGCNGTKVSVPSLQEICIEILSKNADAITSLEGVPDDLRHRLCRLLCDSRKMNSHFFDLLVRGSPTEIRVRDCSWLTEEEFTKLFKGCDTNNLTVLQLDQCGRCMPDYVLLATLADSPRSLPSLATLSLSGACRISDVGLTSLVASVPALQSINLSLCSLLTHASVKTLAESLGSVLRELYIDDCQGIDAMVILPALKKLEHLEVLSVARIETICDNFMRQFTTAHGHNMKELILTECVKLTDFSMKVIAETCSGLRSLDISKLRKLTDSALGYLANGCHQIDTLKLCQNVFSDEAVAAYLETSGELLKELVLNNVKKVDNNTTLSLSKRSRNLQILDLSWCRNLTDEAVGLIVDSCLSLRVLKLFGCGQITNVFLDNHSNPAVQIIGLKLSPVLEHI